MTCNLDLRADKLHFPNRSLNILTKMWYHIYICRCPLSEGFKHVFFHSCDTDLVVSLNRRENQIVFGLSSEPSV